MWNKLWIIVFFNSLQFCSGQSNNTFNIDDNSTSNDTIVAIDRKQTVDEIYNAQAIQSFYTKLQQLEENKDQKVRITHLGDSHIQADFFTSEVRTLLQNNFGNGGLGFSFPYSLAKTNGNYDIKFSSNATFERIKMTSADSSTPLGLSGYALKITSNQFAIELWAKNEDYAFTSIKLLTAANKNSFGLATTWKNTIVEKSKPKRIIHKIKNGEALSIIAQKYNVTVAAIKKANGLKSSNIRAGKTLVIPSNESETENVTTKEYIPLEIASEFKGYSYYSNELLDKIYIIPTENEQDFELSGIILENNKPGIIYNAIGVNGAKAVDFNRFPTFYDDLQVLDSDLIVISLGTNESFDKLEPPVFYQELDKMIATIRSQNPTVEILVTTPPPSLWKKSIPNTLAEEYTQLILVNAASRGYAVWNMFDAMGGLQGVSKNFSNGIIAKDKVHYTKTGYAKQGELFYKALMHTYEQFEGSK